MTGGTVVVLGPVGANFGAGMTGGRAYLYDPSGRHVAALQWRRASRRHAPRPRSSTSGADGPARIEELRRAARGSPGRRLGAGRARLLEDGDLPGAFWVVEPVAVAASPAPGWRCRSATEATADSGAVAPARLTRLDAGQPRRLAGRAVADRGERAFRLGEVEPVVARRAGAT